jgi:hypothetical protein
MWRSSDAHWGDGPILSAGQGLSDRPETATGDHEGLLRGPVGHGQGEGWLHEHKW